MTPWVKCNLVFIDLPEDKSVTFQNIEKGKEQKIGTQAFWKLHLSLNSFKVAKEDIVCQPVLNRYRFPVLEYCPEN